MTTKTMTAAAAGETKSFGPKLKTALPGPNAKRILAGDENIFRRPTPVRIRWWPRADAASSSPTSTAMSSSISPPASP